ncbi:hypothetical protein GWK63_15965 [Komagataeibacter rhaeticus]|uniref:Uncharacterized protein n=1 Tax=Komagataeibacter rhaeticus TaxID=215221 RepID=A0A858JNY5_9PROT|nr:hypothetical protein [Komagataeibacter rhaeticus]QIP36739.1 hypothetical protein GWK63_15965 [Komagataeibacter rhaeticus]
MSGLVTEAEDTCFGYEATPAFANGRDSKAKNQFAEISLPYGHESVRRRNGAKSIIGMPEGSDQNQWPSGTHELDNQGRDLLIFTEN